MKDLTNLTIEQSKKNVAQFEQKYKIYHKALTGSLFKVNLKDQYEVLAKIGRSDEAGNIYLTYESTDGTWKYINPTPGAFKEMNSWDDTWVGKTIAVTCLTQTPKIVGKDDITQDVLDTVESKYGSSALDAYHSMVKNKSVRIVVTSLPDLGSE